MSFKDAVDAELGEVQVRTKMQNLCNVSLRVVARPQSNKIVCYYLNFVNKHLNNSDAMSIK